MTSADVIDDIVDVATSHSAPFGMSTRIIAIDGPGGAGKTTFARILAVTLGDAQIVQTDDFASWDNPLDWWPRLIHDVLSPLSRNLPAHYECSAWAPNHQAAWKTVQPADFVIIEGVSATRDAFRPYLSCSVWIETPPELRLGRGLDRDGEQARRQWEEWMAEENAYVERERPRQRADVVLRGDGDLWR